MVRIVWQLSFVLLLLWSAAATAALSVKVDKKTIVLGEPLIVQLQAEVVREPLSTINLDKLKKDFKVFAISSSTQQKKIKGRNISTETMTLTLYPLRTGKLALPALSYSKKSSKPLQVSVLESSSKTSQVKFKTALDAAQPQVRLASTLSLEIHDDGSLQWTVPRELTVANAYQRKLAESQREETIEGIRYTVHHYAWAIMPLKEGSMTVEFAMLEAYKFGTRLRYPVAPLRFTAAAVPAYLPVHVPIGKPLVSMQALPQELAVDRPVNWSFTVQSAGVSSEGLGKLLSSIRSTDTLRFYPLQISIVDNGRPITAVQTLLVTLPFVPLRTGKLQLPEINLPYYDPASARVESVLLEGKAIEVYSPWWRTVRIIFLVIFALALGVFAGLCLYKKIRRVRKNRKVLIAIAGAKNAMALQHALLDFRYGMQYQTLQQWLQQLKLEYVVDENLNSLVRNLLDKKYGANDGVEDVSGLANEAARMLKKLPVRKTSIARISVKESLVKMLKSCVQG